MIDREVSMISLHIEMHASMRNKARNNKCKRPGSALAAYDALALLELSR
jgi:hypothetical protein